MTGEDITRMFNGASEKSATQSDSTAPTCTANRLWVAKVHYTLLVVADNIHKAHEEAEHYAGEDGSDPDGVDAFAVTEIEEIPLEWRESIPFGGDRKDDRTCAQRVPPNAYG